jgi:hypothetical protein
VGSPAAPAAAGSAGVVAWPRRASGGQDGRARVGGRKVSGRCPGSAGARVAVSRSAGQGGRERTEGGWRRRGGVGEARLLPTGGTIRRGCRANGCN